jgi:hypothetical protein
MFSLDYEKFILEKRLKELNEGYYGRKSRRDFLCSLRWLDEQEQIDKEIARAKKRTS